MNSAPICRDGDEWLVVSGAQKEQDAGMRRRTSIGNFPDIQANCPAYAWSFLMPLGCGSRTLMASWRSASMTSRSCLNMSGCWSYLLLMYCRMTEARDSCVDRRKGSDNMLPVLVPPLLATMLRLCLCLCFAAWDVTPESRGRLVRVKLTSPLWEIRGPGCAAYAYMLQSRIFILP